jgi:outer membrane protein OmpA-like peptidoglycan-associated protein
MTMVNAEERETGATGLILRAVAVVIGIVLAVVAGTVVWTYSTGERVGASAAQEPRTEAPARVRVAAPAPRLSEVAHAGDVVHADVYFDFKSVRLRADAVRVLEEQARLMDRADVWGVLIQGYADRQGPAEYNKALARQRAEAVKQFLVELGVPEASVKTVTVGQDGVLCDEPVPECQQLNRRVHIEIRKLPRAAAAPVPSPLTNADLFDTPSTGTGTPDAGR